MNREDVLQLLRTRYTTKHYDASRPVSDFSKRFASRPPR